MDGGYGVTLVVPRATERSRMVMVRSPPTCSRFSSALWGLGASDLWRSTRQSVHEPWSPPENLGAPLSSTANDVHPSLSHDARTLIFAATRAGRSEERRVGKEWREQWVCDRWTNTE